MGGKEGGVGGEREGKKGRREGQWVSGRAEEGERGEDKKWLCIICSYCASCIGTQLSCIIIESRLVCAQITLHLRILKTYTFKAQISEEQVLDDMNTI